MSEMTPDINHQRNINQKCNELSLHNFRMAMMEKIVNKSVGECGEKGIFVHC